MKTRTCPQPIIIKLQRIDERRVGLGMLVRHARTYSSTGVVMDHFILSAPGVTLPIVELES